MMPRVTPKEKLRVILDSNALFVPLQFRIDIFIELQGLLKRNLDLILLSAVKRELEILAERGPTKMKRDAYNALKFSEKCNYVELGERSTDATDDVIIEVARQWNCPVFTNDKQLRKRLRDISVPVIYVRQKSHLEIDGMI